MEQEIRITFQDRLFKYIYDNGGEATKEELAKYFKVRPDFIRMHVRNLIKRALVNQQKKGPFHVKYVITKIKINRVLDKFKDEYG